MPWFKVDDKLHSHKKSARTGAPALGLWVLCGSWATDQLTDGFVPDYIARRLVPGADKLAAQLVQAGFWTEGEHEGDTGWWFHNWAQFQPTREDVESKRNADRTRQRAHRQRVSQPSSRDNRGRFADESQRDSSVTPPGLAQVSPASRPDPSRTTRTPSSADADAAFDEWWSHYPRKVDKGHARKAYRAASKKATQEQLLAGVRAFGDAVADADPKFIAHAATWLNGERWTDQPTGQDTDQLVGWTPPAPPAEILGDRAALAQHHQRSREAELRRRAGAR